jgi:hypothetical protein
VNGSQNSLSLWVAVGSVLLVVVTWWVVIYLVSFASGWHKLAERFRYEREFEGERWRFQSGIMRWSTRYGNILTLGANREGLYMAIFVLFRTGHPALFLPWSEITVSERRRWFRAGTQFVLGREMQIPLWVFKYAGDRLVALRPMDGSVMGSVYSRAGLDDPRPIA